MTTNFLRGVFMRGANDIIQEAAELPVEERVIVVDSILRTLNPPNPEVDKEWATVARRRLEELRSGRIRPVPGDHVFAKIKELLKR
jgi:hypothetical protein